MVPAQPIPENIPVAISKFRQDGSIPDFSDETLAKPFSGGQCHVLKLVFPDCTECAVRIPVSLSAESAVQTTAAESTVLKLLEKSGFPWSPRLVAEEVNFDNPVQFPFTVYEWIPGQRLQWSDHTPADRRDRDMVIKQLAQALLSLILCTAQPATSPKPLLDYLTRIIHHKIIRICRGSLPGFRVRDCFHHLNLLPQVIDTALDSAPHFIGHGDLAAQNIIIDDHLNLKGILDWSFSASEPFQLAAALPRLFSADATPDPIVRAQDRRSFVQALRDESSAASEHFVAHLVAMYSRPDLDYRQHVLDAVISKGAFAILARGFPQSATADVDDEIARFLGGGAGRRSGLTREDVLEHL